MALDFTGKTAVVTGASSGIGTACARQLARGGANVVLIGRSAERLSAVEGSLSGGKAVSVVVDLAEDGAGEMVASATNDAFGSLDVVVHCAAVLEMAPVAEVDESSIDRMWRTNTRGPILLTKSLIPLLNNNSAVVFVSSTVAHGGFANYAPYSATKGAIEAFARALAVELAPKTRVNVLAPGFVATPMLTDQYPDAPGLEAWVVGATPLGFIGSGDDVATSILMLACDETSRYITGTTVIADGGWTAKA